MVDFTPSSIFIITGNSIAAAGRRRRRWFVQEEIGSCPSFRVEMVVGAKEQVIARTDHNLSTTEEEEIVVDAVSNEQYA